MYIYISHSDKNENTTKRICEMLESNDHICLCASQGSISDSRCDVLLLILSNDSNRSESVLKEIEYAVSHCVPTLVYQIEDVRLSKPLEYFLMSNQWIVGKDADNYEKILEGIKNIEDNRSRQSKEDGRDDETKDKKRSVFTGEYKVRSKNRDKRKRVLELIEFIAIAAICIAMFFHEKGSRVSFEKGSAVIFGTYLGEPIQWRVLKAHENGTATLISEYILTNKAFDVPESGIYNMDDENNDYWSVVETEADRNLELQEYVRGSSRWATSDIRTWLNSDEENVTYDGIGPVASATSEKKNGYANEEGFLFGFTEQEKEAIVPTLNITQGNALDKEPIESTDLVWLLSQEELLWLKDADVKLYVKPTEQAIEQDQTNYYNIFSLVYGVEEYYWWLRDPVVNKSSKCYLVDNGYTSELLQTTEAGVSGFGVRPVIRVYTKKVKNITHN
ncbi:MAG: toll/interleukin-1 receptor domain-containing protein [Lachnospiraceae bacterium]|nr:toll/interleukin-1 receptor domain-containing protein [Lachnospiraceae bacterium]